MPRACRHFALQPFLLPSFRIPQWRHCCPQFHCLQAKLTPSNSTSTRDLSRELWGCTGHVLCSVLKTHHAAACIPRFMHHSCFPKITSEQTASMLVRLILRNFLQVASMIFSFGLTSCTLQNANRWGYDNSYVAWCSLQRPLKPPKRFPFPVLVC